MAKLGLQLTRKPANMGAGSRERSREENSQSIWMARAEVSVGSPAPLAVFSHGSHFITDETLSQLSIRTALLLAMKPDLNALDAFLFLSLFTLHLILCTHFMQITPTMKYPHAATRTAKVKKADNSKC